MNTDYFSSFTEYLRTGNTSDLSNYLEAFENEEILSVYRNGFYKSCIEALASNFPVTKIILGEEKFNFLAVQYIDKNLPKHGTLVGYGNRFSHFLKKAIYCNNPQLSGISYEISILDKAWLDCLNSKSEAFKLTAERIIKLTQADQNITQLSLVLPSDVQLISLSLNSFELWLSIKEHESLPMQVSLTQQPEKVIFWQNQGQVIGKTLSSIESLFFTKLASNQHCFESIVDEINKAYSEEDVSKLFSACLENGLIASPDIFALK